MIEWRRNGGGREMDCMEAGICICVKKKREGGNNPEEVQSFGCRLH